MRKGFSFIELIIVVVIIAILAVVAIPRILDIGDMRLSVALGKVAGDIKFAREFAMNYNRRTRITFLSAQNRYIVEALNSFTSAWEVLEDPATRDDFDIILNTGHYKKVEISSASFDGQNRVEFDSVGAPSTTSGPLAATGAVNMKYTGSTSTSTINVEPVTGRVDIP